MLDFVVDGLNVVLERLAVLGDMAALVALEQPALVLSPHMLL